MKRLTRLLGFFKAREGFFAHFRKKVLMPPNKSKHLYICIDTDIHYSIPIVLHGVNFEMVR